MKDFQPGDPTTRFYDARGNIYGVVSPACLRRHGVEVPDTAALAASRRDAWALPAIAAECGWGPSPRPAGAKAHRCDGLLVGPFQAAPPFDLLIVNTDGSLAERSGNGLTIFAQALSDQGLMTQGCELRVHHDKQDAKSPLATYVEPALHEQVRGFWLALGQPAFGPLAVGADLPRHRRGGVQPCARAGGDQPGMDAQPVCAGGQPPLRDVGVPGRCAAGQSVDAPERTVRALAGDCICATCRAWPALCGRGQLAMGCPGVRQSSACAGVRAGRGADGVLRDQRLCRGVRRVARRLGRGRGGRGGDAGRYGAGSVADSGCDSAERQPVRGCAAAARCRAARLIASSRISGCPSNPACYKNVTCAGWRFINTLPLRIEYSARPWLRITS